MVCAASAAAAAVVAAVAAGAAPAVSAAAEDEQEYNDDPEAASVSISAEHLIDLSPRYVIYPGPAPRGGGGRGELSDRSGRCRRRFAPSEP